jgi:type IV pilus assembly protein PilE
MTNSTSMTVRSFAGSRRRKGFTLIELVVAMVVAAILAAIAIPAYSSYVRKARRTDVKSALLDLASLEERYYSTANKYSQTASELGYGAFPAIIGNGNGTYTIATPGTVDATASSGTTVGTPASYTITATAILDQLNDTQCRTFTVTSGGGQTATDSGGVDATAACWR